ncbi:DUF3427 domain-containing protein [Acinetobacter schindleri]|nr:DUF3427 domain-containing protein [Acinetobacter schindleri]
MRGALHFKSLCNKADFYFIGFLSYIEGSAQETLMQTDAGPVSVVKIDFRINKPVENGLYKYLVNI